MPSELSDTTAAPSGRLSPTQRSLRARMAAHTLHSRVDSREHTAPARRAFLDRFVEQVDPDRHLGEAERQRRARSALRAHMASLALKSAQARSAKEVR